MKRSKLGAISAVVGIILGIMIILVGVNFVVGKVDVAKYGNELKELIQNNEYGQKALALGDKVWKKVPQKYEGYALGGLAGLAGLYLVVAGILCLRKEAKKSFIVFASIETVVLVVLGALFALTFNTYILVVAVLYALLLPVPKYIGRGNFKAREEEYKDRKTVTSPFEKLIGSHKSKKTKKGKAVKKDKKEKVLSKPISTVGARTEEKVDDKQKKTKKQKTKKQKKVQKIK